ncbi:MAG TPA: ABC transporter permease [Thermoleophilia bacterium]|nr:ABC transporter permease [Thermoleophilia bacterium]HQG02744.1 ABC transporter permease [Thermoleophilia bacterium]HQJ97083.1 ABC transporter permease [Thermoleophilia bacterium]
MRRLVVRRLLLMVPTLLVVSVLIFLMAEIVPGDVGRSILGPYASPEQVAALNHKLGADRPLVERYVRWLGGFVTGDWGESPILQAPVTRVTFESLVNSLLLAAIALVVIVPTSIVLGVLAALRRDSLLDRFISVTSLSLTVIPEFVSGVILLVLFAVVLPWFPVTASAPPGADLLTRIYHLILPAVPLMFVEMGYIARMARAGTLEVLDMPYVRTAVLKGLPQRRVVTRHVLRNGLLSTVTVVGAQVGWLVGGLVVVEKLFNYPGIGRLMAQAATLHDVKVLEATVLVVAAIYMLSNLTADVVVAALSPRVRLGG